MPKAVGAMDTKFVVNYFQKTFDNRLLFGGGEKYTPNWPKDIAGFVRKNLLKIYPQLENVKIEHAWGGALGITPTRLPFVRKIGKSIYSASGYSGPVSYTHLDVYKRQVKRHTASRTGVTEPPKLDARFLRLNACPGASSPRANDCLSFT